MDGRGDDLDVLHDEAGWRVGIWNNLLFTAISQAPSATSLAHVRRGQRRLLEMDGPIGGLTLVVGLRLGPLDLTEAMRDELKQMMNVPNLRGHSAIVIESDGFAGAAVRAVLGAVILLAHTDSPQKMFESREAAARYLAAHAPGGWNTEQLLIAAHRFTEGLGRSIGG
ncbi:MAG: hypothetical protein HOW73_18980 [Polyangiaceae bacterium]|nr:hypothetical protein [Polyangiaceae bacterium]